MLVLRRFGWGYAVYSLAIVGIPLLGTGDFQGMGRYLLGGFPGVRRGRRLAGRARRRALTAVRCVTVRVELLVALASSVRPRLLPDLTEPAEQLD